MEVESLLGDGVLMLPELTLPVLGGEAVAPLCVF
jgi:hypothetical protein